MIMWNATPHQSLTFHKAVITTLYSNSWRRHKTQRSSSKWLGPTFKQL